MDLEKKYLSEEYFYKFNHLFTDNTKKYNNFATIKTIKNFDYDFLNKYKIVNFYFIGYNGLDIDGIDTDNDYELFIILSDHLFFNVSITSSFKLFHIIYVDNVTKDITMKKYYRMRHELAISFYIKKIPNIQNIIMKEYQTYYNNKNRLVKTEKMDIYEICFNYSNNNISISKNIESMEDYYEQNLTQKYKSTPIKYYPNIYYLHFNKENNKFNKFYYDLEFKNIYCIINKIDNFGCVGSILNFKLIILF